MATSTGSSSLDSASAEKVFLSSKLFLSETIFSSLEDYIETSLYMLQYFNCLSIPEVL